MTTDELLIVDDLMLLLMDDDGASMQGATMTSPEPASVTASRQLAADSRDRRREVRGRPRDERPLRDG